VSVGFVLACAIFCGGGAFVRAVSHAQTTSQAEQATSTLTMEQLTTAAKHFFRDTAEFPLLQTMTMAVTDPAGRVIKTTNLSVDYVFRGFSPRTNSTYGQVRGNISIWQAMGGAKVLKLALNSDIWTMVAGQELIADSGQYVLVANNDHTRAGLITAKLTRVEPCPMATMKNRAETFAPDVPCGASEFELKEDLSFQKFSFEVAGLPAPVKVSPFGQCTLQKYHAEIEFQSVMVAGEKDPFIVPKIVTASLETSKGKILIVSEYEAKARVK